MSGLRLAATAGIWAAIAVVACLLLVLAVPRLVGGHSYSVLSNSMHPVIETGDQVVALPRPVAAVAPGEIVVFNDPEGSGRLFQHRVQRTWRRGAEVEVVTMGDANSGFERWSLPADSSIEVVTTVLPRAGYIVGPFAGRPLRLVASGIAWLALLTTLLLMIWRRPAEHSLGAAAR